MNLSKTTLVLLAFAGLAILLLASSASADQGNERWQDAIEVYDSPDPIVATVTSAASGSLDDDWFRIEVNEGNFLKLSMIFDASQGLAGIDVYGPNDAYRLRAWRDRLQVEIVAMERERAALQEELRRRQTMTWLD